MNRKSVKTEALNNKIDSKIKNVDYLNHFNKIKDRDLRNYNKLKDTNDSKNNKLKDMIDSKPNNKNIKDRNDSKNCNKSKDLIDSKNIDKLKDTSDMYNNKIKDRGDLKIAIKPAESRMKKDEVVKHKIINPDGDTQKVSLNQRPEKFNDATKQSVAKNSEGLKALWNKRTVVRNAQALATVDLKRIRERYTMKLRNPTRPTIPPKKEENVSTSVELKNVPIKKETKGGSLIIHVKKQENTPHLPQAAQKTHDLPHAVHKAHKLLHNAQKNHELSHIAQKNHDLSHVAQKIHDSSHVAQKIHDSSNLAQKNHDSSYIAQKNHDSPHIVQKIHDLPPITQKTHDLPQVAQKTYDLTQVVHNTHDLPHTIAKSNEKEPRKKPVIRTIMTKNGSTRIYKAVTFEEHKVKPTTLEINIPNDSLKKPNSTKSSDVNSLKSKVTVSKISVREKKTMPKKSTHKRDRKHRRHLPSRDFSAQNIHARSPPTEVAKWAPTSITTHTKPYYEAWVDTTLTAVSKSEKLQNEKMSILKCLQQALERPSTPELFYCNYADERYAGRIKIRHPR